MKKNTKFITLTALFLSTLTLCSLSNQYTVSAKADSWESLETKALPAEGLYLYDGSDSYLYITLTNNDYTSMSETDGYLYVGSAANYVKTDYNFNTYIEVSNDNISYVSFSTISSGHDLFFKNGTLRVGINHKGDPQETKTRSTYKYIRILKGCEFPSYSYCKNGGSLKKYVQKETTISELKNETDVAGVASKTIYNEVTEKKSLPYTGIPYGWNNSGANASTFRSLILQFGTYGTDYLSKDKTPNAENRAFSTYDIGNKLTINGIPVYKLHDKENLVRVTYEHGYGFLYICYPTSVLELTKNYLVPTLHIEKDTVFMDTLLPEVTLKFVGGGWVASNSGSFTVENPLNIDDYRFVDFPFSMGAAACVLRSLPSTGCNLSFSINTGKVDLTDPTAAINFAFYGLTLGIYESSGTIVLAHTGGADIQVFKGFQFAQNTDYIFEFEVVAGQTSTFKLAINHLLIIDATISKNIGSSGLDMWALDTLGTWVINYYKELKFYSPTLNYGGTTSYEFLEGDPVYNFESVVKAYSLYDDSISKTNVEYIYDEGAVTDGRYNAGKWNLAIKLEAAGYPTTVKNITINVHGTTSMAKISYDGGEIIEAPIGTKLLPPPNPETYRSGDYDYVFDGWYFNGAKWDFENDYVEGDMDFVSVFVPMPRHYVVTASFEGIEKNNETYSVSKGTTLSFDVFEMEGASFVVYLNETPITSLVVNDDVNIVVKYTIEFTYVNPKEPTCTEDGNLGYWYSNIYAGYYFGDSKGREVIQNVIIPKLNHDIIHLDYTDSTCAELGNVDCYYCNNCRLHFSDEKAENQLINWSIAKKPHYLSHHDEHDASCTEDGNIEYWTCANEPGVYYSDEACTTKVDDVVIKAFGHDYRAPTYEWIEIDGGYKCVARISCTHCQDEISETRVATKIIVRESTCSREGQVSFWVDFNDDRFNSQTKIVNLEKIDHKYVHVDEIVATKDSLGVKEHYECSECHKLFVKDGNRYKEVNYSALVYEYKAGGCGGNIAVTSLMLTLLAGGALTVLVMLKRKEER